MTRDVEPGGFFKMQRFRLSTRGRWSIGAVLVAVVGSFAGLGGVAYASGGTITAPATNPYVATYDATGNFLSYVTVRAPGSRRAQRCTSSSATACRRATRPGTRRSTAISAPPRRR